MFLFQKNYVSWLVLFLLFHSACGPNCPSGNEVSHSSQTQAIINGTVANEQTSSQVVWIWDDQHQDGRITGCTGVLVNNEWVLTAGHCLDDTDTSHYTIYLGSNLAPLLMKGSPSLDTQIKWVDRILQNPDYVASNPVPSTDIGLLHVTTPFIVNQSSSGYALNIYADTSDSLVGKTITLFGYGCYEASSSTNYATDGNLREATLSVISVSGGHLIMQKNSLGQSSCFGDSGGPYFLEGTQTLVAIGNAGNVQAGTSIGVPSDTFRAWLLAQTALTTNSEVSCEN